MQAAKALASRWIRAGSPELLLLGDPKSTKILCVGLYFEKKSGIHQVDGTAFISVPPGKETSKKFYKLLQNS